MEQRRTPDNSWPMVAPPNTWSEADAPAPAPPGPIAAPPLLLPLPPPAAPPVMPVTGGRSPRKRLDVIAGVLFVLVGLLLMVVPGPDQNLTAEVTGFVLVTPTPSGGVLLQVPMRDAYYGTGAITPQTWETGPIAGVSVGDAVPVELDAGCMCNPHLPSGHEAKQTYPFRRVGLLLVVMGALVAWVSHRRRRTEERNAEARARVLAVGGPAAALVAANPTADPYPATPDPELAAQRAVARAKEQRSGSVRVLTVVIGVALGIWLAATSIGHGEPSWLESAAPPLLAIVAFTVLGRVRLNRMTSARQASLDALERDEPPVPVRMEVSWAGHLPKVRTRLEVRDEQTGAILGDVTLRIAAGVFDPRGPMWLHGRAEQGGAVALVPADGRPPLLSSAPFTVVDPADREDAHPCTPLVLRLLGWSEPSEARAAATLAAGPLADAARAVVVRLKRYAQVRVFGSLGLVYAAMLLHLELVPSAILTAAVWGVWRAGRSVAGTWLVRPLTVELQRLEGLGEADAEFVARALTALGFGQSAPVLVPGEEGPGPGTPSPVTVAAPPGWGYPPQ